MSERSHRRPQTFRLDDPAVVVMDPDEHARPSRGTVRVTPEPDPALTPVPIDTPLDSGSARLSLGRTVLGRIEWAGAARRRA